MNQFLTAAQGERYAAFQEFAAANVEPFAGGWDQAQTIPPAALAQLARAGYLGSNLPAEYGGQGWDAVTFGLLNEALGRSDSALTGVVTVQSMISAALLKWGSAEQRRQWLPPLAQGDVIGAFALTEAGAGSDLHSMATTYRRVEGSNDLVLNGEKKWISCGQMAGIFLVFGKLDDKPVACLVPRDTKGFEIEPIKDLMGFRAAGLARLRFHDVHIPAAHIVGKPGFGLSHVAQVGLQFGRLSTACSALGLLRACFEESTGYAASRRAGGHRIGELGMIQSLLAKMGTDMEAARLLCWSACRAEDEHSPETYTRAFMAKYFASRAAVHAAADAVQIHGAAGCHESSSSSSVSRLYRNSKIMEIIEGTTQIHELVLGQEFMQNKVWRTRAPKGSSPANPEGKT